MNIQSAPHVHGSQHKFMTAFALVFLQLVLAATLASATTRVALVIGNSAYRSAPLSNPVNDAKLIAARLKQLDFTVMEYLNADQRTMKRAIQRFGEKLDEAGREATGLFYYAGHGIQVNGENFLIPVRARIDRESDVGIEAVNASAVLGVLDYARTQINFVIIDACRNNPFARSFRSSHRGLARMDAPQGTLVAYATAPGDVAADGEGSNSPYSAALAEAMQQPNIPVEQMFKMVRRKVMAQTANAQVPWESSSLTGNFYFNESGEQQQHQLEPTATVTAVDIDKDALFWQSIKDSDKVEDFKEYLLQFPNGTFARLAHSRIAAISGTATTTTGTTPEATSPSDLPPPSVPPPSTPRPQTEGKPQQTRPLPLARGTELEPNNTIGKSNLISPSSNLSGRIDPQRDVDWYMIPVRQHGQLDIKVGNVAPEMDYALRVWDSEYRTISGWLAPLRVGAETSGEVDLPAPGIYFIELRDGRDDTASRQSYDLTLLFTPSADRYEPNDSFGTAVQIVPPIQLTTTILPLRDSDWYRMNFDHHGELKVSVTGVPSSLDISLRLWNADKRTITGWYTPLTAGGDTEAVIDIPEPGSYILELRDGRDDSRSVQPFSTSISFTPSQDRFEPNNSYGQASPLAIGETINGTILPVQDSDWYRLDVDEQGELKVKISKVHEDLDISFRVWNSELQTHTGWLTPLKAGGDTEATIDLPSGGGYILEVRDGRNDARSVSPYALRATYTPTNDRSEPNNSFGTAAPLKLGSQVTGTILPKGDADWYRVYVGRAGSLTVTTSGVPENLDVVMRVWNEEKRTISGWIAPLRAGGDASGEVSIPAAGQYYIEVHDGRDDDRSVLPYHLRTSMQ